MSVRGINKVKREFGFVLMAFNIRKVVAQPAEIIKKFIKKTISILIDRNCLFLFIQKLYIPDLLS